MKYLKTYEELRPHERFISLGKRDIIPFVKRIVKKMGYDSHYINDDSYLGEGGWGMAFRVSKDKVIKITGDKSEAGSSSLLLNCETKNVINIHVVKKITNPFFKKIRPFMKGLLLGVSPKLYIIVMDLIDPLEPEDWDIFRSLGKKYPGWLKDGDYRGTQKFILENFDKNASGMESDLYNGCLELYKCGITNYKDIKIDNIGKKGGYYILVDIGDEVKVNKKIKIDSIKV